jgi:hypothetical protein
MLGPLSLLFATDPPAAPYLLGIVLGFVVGGIGHIVRAPTLIILGILTIVITTVLFIIATDPSLGS